MKRLYRRKRRRFLDDRHEVDDLERRDLPGALILAERHGALFRDVPVARHGNDEQVAEGASLFEMLQVAGVHEVERAMTLDDAAIAKPFADPRQFLDRDDLVALADGPGPNHAGCVRPFSAKPDRTASSRNILTVASENSVRSLADSSSFWMMSGVAVMMWQPTASA